MGKSKLIEQQHSYADTNWYTPEKYITLVKEVLGEIELDPASNEWANQIVGAKRFFSEEDDGLSQDWKCATLFMNPPGKTKNSRGASAWHEHLLRQYLQGNVGEAIALIFKVATETKWFQAYLDYPICFVKGRIQFIPPVGKYAKIKSGNYHGQAFVYLGRNVERFKSIFELIGKVK